MSNYDKFAWALLDLLAMTALPIWVDHKTGKLWLGILSGVAADAFIWFGLDYLLRHGGAR